MVAVSLKKKQPIRSEERRGGKECRSRGSPYHSKKKRTLGQCPFHLSVYDLRRHGIIVSGQAYQSLPQVLLELEGDDIYAVGMMGLLYGRNENLMTA